MPPSVPEGPSLGCGHVNNHKALDVREVVTDEVHLQLPGATLGRGDVELDRSLLLGLQAGHPAGQRRRRGRPSALSLA